MGLSVTTCMGVWQLSVVSPVALHIFLRILTFYRLWYTSTMCQGSGSYSTLVFRMCMYFASVLRRRRNYFCNYVAFLPSDSINSLLLNAFCCRCGTFPGLVAAFV